MPVAQVVALAALTVLWMDRHLGFGLRDPGPLAALVTAVGVGWGLVQFLARDAAPGVTSRVVRYGRALFSRRLRLAWAAALVLLVANVSSVTLVSSSSSPLPASLAPVGARTFAVSDPAEDGEATRWLVRASPFGALFSLAAKGHVRETLEVFPLVGKRVRQRDLRQSSTILIRPGVESLQALVKGRLLVWLDRRGGPRVAEFGGAQSAVLVGGRQPIPAAWTEDWKLELSSLVPDPAAAAPILLIWKRPVPVVPEIGLGPGMVLVAEVQNQKGHAIASRTVTLGDEALVDLYLQDGVIEE